MKRRIATVIAATLTLAGGFGIGFGVAANATGPNSIIVCFANSSLATGNGTMQNKGSGLYEEYHPTFHTGSGTDGHGMLLTNAGSNQGAC